MRALRRYRHASPACQWRKQLQVRDAATASEKAELSREFIKKKNAYVKKRTTKGQKRAPRIERIVGS
jgi:hypothetical protein